MLLASFSDNVPRTARILAVRPCLVLPQGFLAVPISGASRRTSVPTARRQVPPEAPGTAGIAGILRVFHAAALPLRRATEGEGPTSERVVLQVAVVAATGLP